MQLHGLHRQAGELEANRKRQFLWLSIFNATNSFSVIIFRKNKTECFLPPFSTPSAISVQMFHGASAGGKGREVS